MVQDTFAVYWLCYAEARSSEAEYPWKLEDHAVWRSKKKTRVNWGAFIKRWRSSLGPEHLGHVLKELVRFIL
ncbi:hypothetical protein NQ315_001645 [Exocentrus adspersus]|uniref:Uncharacterized protein n=1 Tax=Exocentrus adspersus TaxID=1586481 RepID=A0AAV8W940_9CUCU|nr:hypothetical protein NQ315_001645 [Exocentrus adspersus]